MTLAADLMFEERDEAYEYHKATVGADFDLIKFDAGLLALGMTWVTLPDLFIVWARAKGNARWLAQHTNGCPNFFFAFDCEHQFWGREMSPSHAVFGTGSGIRDGSFRNGCTTLDITISLELSERLGWSVERDEIHETDPKSLLDLRSVCHHATVRSRSLTNSGSTIWPAGEADRWQGLILDSLEHAARPWFSSEERQGKRICSPPNHHRIVLDAEEFLHEHAESGAVTVAELSDRLGIPERTLYHSFRQSLGLGPRRYMELLRVHEFRRRLKSANQSTARVLDIAHELGFTEPGRLAQRYKTLFGELPSQTLRSR